MTAGISPIAYVARFGFAACDNCGAAMRPEGAHDRCDHCGTITTCCEGSAL